MHWMGGWVGGEGSPLLFGFDPVGLEADLEGSGFKLISDVGAAVVHELSLQLGQQTVCADFHDQAGNVASS